ncbi:MAG: 30S ribosomal protein S20 [Alphaproteobacteria bacterium]|nr:30S ribosomal protein S20 [Alphaproteobacteria bacterium]MBU0859448.1 30S ribosomal protein S20 [Alphaproteobacteria bacterium]
MANHASSKKRIRRNARFDKINADRRGRIRTFIKKVELALTNGDAKEAEVALKAAQPELQRSVAKGILPKNTAARKISRLSASIKALKKAA